MRRLNKANKWCIVMALFFSMIVLGCGDSDDDDQKKSILPDDDDDDNDTGSALDDDDTADDDNADDNDDDVDDDADDDADDDDDDTVPCNWTAHDLLIEQGKHQLQISSIYEAYESFADAQDLCPESVDARMGQAMTLMIELERTIYEIYLFLQNGPYKSSSRSFGSQVQDMLYFQHLPLAEEMIEHAQMAQQADDSWSFFIGVYPFVIEGELEDIILVDMGGEWDHADARMIEVFGELWRGMIHFVCAYNMTFDYQMINEMPSMTGTLDEIIYDIAGWFLEWVDDPNYPDFLILYPGDGAEHLSEAGLSFGAMLTGMDEAADMMLLETDDQADDVSGYVDENGNGMWDDGELYQVPYFGTLTADENEIWLGILDLAISAGHSLWNGSTHDVHPFLPDWAFLSDFNFLLEALGITPNLPPIPLDLGEFFHNPQPTGLKDAARTLMTLLYTLTESVPAHGGKR